MFPGTTVATQYDGAYQITNPFFIGGFASLRTNPETLVPAPSLAVDISLITTFLIEPFDVLFIQLGEVRSVEFSARHSERA